jgi:hypothetical protein
MADSQKISELQGLVEPSGNDLLLIVDVPASPSTPKITKNITVSSFLEQLPANTSIVNGSTFTVSGNTYFTGANNTLSGTTNLYNTKTNTLTVTSNGFIVLNKLTPANSSVAAITTGKWFFDENYLYIKVANTVIKRVALQSF